MALKVVLILALVALANARRAPNADYVEQLLRSEPQSRFSSDVEEDSLLDVPGLIQKYGYPQETHHITTSDGYILEAHRIPHGRDNHNTPGARPVVFMMHGLLSSSSDFVVLGPGNALSYVLAEAGYDVWLGNARGNFYSRNHVSLSPDASNQNFWRFSWDEIGNHDLPAFIDYILAVTGQEKLHYVGHSQGGTSFLVLNSLRPEYNDKIISFQGLAPASFFNNNEVSMFNSLAPYEAVLESAAFAMGLGEVFGSQEFVLWFRNNFCGEDSMFTELCGSALSGITEREYYNSTMVPLLLAHVPAGASVRQFSHYGQVIRFGSFRRYNYNIITNLSIYGRVTPPDYDLSKITVPSYIYYGLSDNEVNYRDIYTLVDTLPNVIGKYQAARDSFNHYDFIWGIDVKEMVYDNLLNNLKDAESRL